MGAWTPHHLSGSTDGKGIKVVATATAGTTIHQTAADDDAYDYVDLWCFNSSAKTETITLEVGGVTDPDNIIEILVPPYSWSPLVENLMVSGTSGPAALSIAAFATTASVNVIYGTVRRFTT